MDISKYITPLFKSTSFLIDQVYKSPQADMGYDIADYEDIDPSYGTLADVDNLIKEIKKRDMKLVMDLVVNHTSDQVCGAFACLLCRCASRFGS
jgi:glycosidase